MASRFARGAKLRNAKIYYRKKAPCGIATRRFGRGGWSMPKRTKPLVVGAVDEHCRHHNSPHHKEQGERSRDGRFPLSYLNTEHVTGLRLFVCHNLLGGLRVDYNFYTELNPIVIIPPFLYKCQPCSEFWHRCNPRPWRNAKIYYGVNHAKTALLGGFCYHSLFCSVQCVGLSRLSNAV